MVRGLKILPEELQYISKLINYIFDGKRSEVHNKFSDISDSVVDRL